LGLLSACATQGDTPDAGTDTVVNQDTVMNQDADALIRDADTPDAGAGPPSYFASHLPKNPAEAFDLDAIKNARLSTLLWTQTDSYVVDGVRVVDGTFSPGTYTGPLADGSGIKTIVMKSRARILSRKQLDGPARSCLCGAHRKRC